MIQSMGVDLEEKATLLKILVMVLEDLWAETKEPAQYRNLNVRVHFDMNIRGSGSS